MRITFIRPNMAGGFANDAFQPLVFAVLSALTPKHIERKLYDERIEDVPFDEATDLVAMTVDTFSARRAYQIAAIYHARGIPVVMGGHHPTLCASEALRYARSVVIGDGEDVWSTVLEDAQLKQLKRLYRSDNGPVRYPPSDRRIFAGKRYVEADLVQWGRGCRFACDFCSVRAFYGNNVRFRPIADFVAEIEKLERRTIVLTDDNPFTDEKTAKEFFCAIRPLKCRWFSQVSLALAADRKLISLMADSGCFGVMVGLESLESGNLRQMQKSWNLASGGFEEQVRAFTDHGILFYGQFVLGYDHDTVETIDRCVDFARRLKFALAGFNPLVPTPGTPVYERLRAEGRLINDPWWLHPGFRFGHSTFHPRGMTADELTAGCYRARVNFNSVGSIVCRAVDRKANARSFRNFGMYLVGNRLNRREMYRKQDLPLGDGSDTPPLFEDRPL